MAELKRFIGIAAAGKALSQEEAVEAFDIMMSGQATPAQIGALLMALRVRGENIEGHGLSECHRYCRHGWRPVRLL